MKHTCKKFFIPHEENNYHPHILHTKRAICYSIFFILLKIGIIGFAALLPMQVFVMPDVLKKQQGDIVSLTNALREKQGLALLDTKIKLNTSSQNKADDMKEKTYFAHKGPDGKGLKEYMKEVDYEYMYAGENLAMGFSDAKELVQAWIDSPTHYANLVDSDFSEFGIGLTAGEYNGMPTIYVAQHFGAPVEKTNTTPPNDEQEKTLETTTSTLQVALYTEPKPSFKKETTSTLPNEIVAGNKEETIPATAPQIQEELPKQTKPIITAHIQQTDEKTNNTAITYFPENSHVEWHTTEKGNVTASAYAHIEGSVKSVVVTYNQFSFPLSKGDEPDVYKGTLETSKTPDDFFRVVISPSITIQPTQGEKISDIISWKHPYITSLTPFEKYTRAKNTLGGITKIFDVSRTVYLGFIIFFSIALLLKIFIQIKKQHYHIIGQTLLLIALLAVLFNI